MSILENSSKLHSFWPRVPMLTRTGRWYRHHPQHSAWETWSIMVKRSICAGWGQTHRILSCWRSVIYLHLQFYNLQSTCPATFSRNYLSCQPAALGGMTRTLEDNFSSYLLLLILIILIWICAGDDLQFVKTPLNRNHWLEGPRCPAPPNQPLSLSCFIIGDTYEDSFRSSLYEGWSRYLVGDHFS